VKAFVSWQQGVFEDKERKALVTALKTKPNGLSLGTKLFKGASRKRSF